MRRGSKADEADISKGYILTLIDGKEIKDLADFKKKYAQYIENSKKSYMLFLKYAQRRLYALIKGDK